MKIFLLNPEPPYFRRRFVMRRNRIFPPISLGIIAHSLEKAGHDIVLLDANALHLKENQVLKEIRKFRPELLIYSSDRHDAWQLPVPDHGYMQKFFRAYAHGDGRAESVLMIGPHGTLFPEVLLEELPAADYLVRGEPEEKVLKFIDALERGAPRAAPGISYRRKSGEVAHNPDPGFIEDLDALPQPAYHLLPMHRYQDNTAPGEPFGLVITSRGCPMSCIFCSKSMYGSKFRTRSIDLVLDELDLLVRRYGVTRVFFHDQILLFKRKRIEELLRAMIDREYRLTWRCQTRLFTLDGEILGLMKAAGCTEIHVGLESISPSVQSAVKKSDADTEKFIEIHELGRKLGVSISPNMIIGLPNESKESVMESARFYHALGFDFLPNVAIPYPDTYLYEIGCKEGKIREKTWRAVVDAAGMPGNRLSLDELEEVLKEVNDLNRRLRRKRLTAKQKLLTAPGYLYRKVRSTLAGR